MHIAKVALILVGGITHIQALQFCPAIFCIAFVCDVKKCHAQLGAKCIPRCNGCFLDRFEDDFGNDITDKCQCDPGVKPQKCDQNLCKNAKCYRPMTQCRIDSCGNCRAVFYDKYAREIPECTTYQEPTGGICPPLPPDTFGTCVELCGAGCPPPKLCCSNGCGHVCKEPYFPVNGPQCPILPHGVKGLCVSECKTDSDCGSFKKCCSTGCGRECRTPLPDACNTMLCIAPACSVQTCATHTQASCLGACNSCVAIFVDKFKNYIGEKCACPGRIFEADCADNLCDSRKCKAHPKAECRINRCGGCNIAFFDEKGKEVDCEKQKGGDMFSNLWQYYIWYQLFYQSLGNPYHMQNDRCPKNPPPGPSICTEHCTKDSDCYQGKVCCSYGCRRLCMSPELDSQCPPTSPVPSIICPAVLPQCYSNSDCGQGEICCRTPDGCTTVCRPTLVFDSRCPPVSGYGKCAQECSDNAQCVAGKICCSNGCGTYCHQLSFRDPRCPPVNPPTSPFEQICPAVEPECYNDGDCNAGKICCSSSNGCTTNCVPVLVTDPRCPSNDNVVGPCINLCMSNKQCEGNRICCKVGGGTQCRDVSSVQDARCPPPDPDIIAKLPFLTCTTSTCVDNSQCPTGQICCSDGCSNKCLNIPTTGGSYDDRCPLPVAPVSQIECVHQCSSNSDCKSNYMCCGLYCGSKCVPKPTQPCDPGELMAPCRNTCEELQLTCPNKPSAQCWIYGCNGCKTEFYDENNVIVDCGQ